MSDKVVVGYKSSRVADINGEPIRVEVDAKLYSYRGQEPHFSVTATLSEKKRNGRWYETGGGSCHEKILAAFPELAPVVNVHLSDENGVPMHAVDNAFTWAGGNGRDQITKAGTAKHTVRGTLESYGCTEEQINAAFVACGLADQPDTEWKRYDGTPNAKHLAKHLRVNLRIAASLCKSVCRGEMTKDDMAAYVDTLGPQWKREASKAISVLKELSKESS